MYDSTLFVLWYVRYRVSYSNRGASFSSISLLHFEKPNTICLFDYFPVFFYSAALGVNGGSTRNFMKYVKANCE